MSPRATSKTWLSRIAFAAVVAALTAGACCVYHAVSVSARAEYALHATLLTVSLVEDYVRQNNGAWPDSWADLQTLPPREGGMFAWPNDHRQLQEYVSIDFAVDPAKLAKQSRDDFAAIRPIPPSYPYKDYQQVSSLLKAISEASLKNLPNLFESPACSTKPFASYCSPIIDRFV